LRRLFAFLEVKTCNRDFSPTSDRIVEMKTVFLIFLLAAVHFADAQDSNAAQALAGCYELKVMR
jgi:hypothetical protein